MHDVEAAVTGRSDGAKSTRDEVSDWVRPHWGVMHGLALRLSPPGDADDCVQEALVAAWRKWSQFDSARGTPRSWLLAIVADQAHKSRRRIRPVAEIAEVMNCAQGTVKSTLSAARSALRVSLGQEFR